MSHSPSVAGQKLIAEASTKLLIYFKDGNSRTFHGRPNASSYTPVDPRELEIKRLKRYAESVGPKINVAILYDLHTGQELARLKNGQWV
ncbi:hypothetical protein [Hymenobacter terricola]|uniref:hypothetical protein n=1 Tax=Hymenobacter terricola TaxID=2819236 RepID=UPI001B304391|nr:hypothetical protein [Hymenobacter terricola]